VRRYRAESSRLRFGSRPFFATPTARSVEVMRVAAQAARRCLQFRLIVGAGTASGAYGVSAPLVIRPLDRPTTAG